MKIFILLLYLAISLYGLYALKANEPAFSLPYLSGFVAYAVGFLLWAIVLRFYPLSLAFPLAAGALIVGTQALGYFALSEDFSISKLVAVSLIGIGLTMLAAQALYE